MYPQARYVLLQCAFIDEWFGDTESAWKHALRAYELQDDGEKIPIVFGVLWQSHNALARNEEPFTFLVESYETHQEWTKMDELASRVMKSEFRSERSRVSEILRAYFRHNMTADAWKVVDELARNGDGQIIETVFVDLVRCSETADKKKVVSLMDEVRATTSGAYALEAKGWLPQAEDWYKQLAQGGQSEDKRGYRSQIDLANFYVRCKQPAKALAIYSNILEKIEASIRVNEAGVKECLRDLDRVQRQLAYTGGFKLSDEVTNRLDKIADLRKQCNRRLEQLQCLKLSDELHDTGWRLEQRDQHLAARKMYESSLKIREKNLGANDVCLVPVLVDLARLEANSGDKYCAADYFERALKIAQTSPGINRDVKRNALENYAQFLERTGQADKASAIYDITRSLP